MDGPEGGPGPGGQQRERCQNCMKTFVNISSLNRHLQICQKPKRKTLKRKVKDLFSDCCHSGEASGQTEQQSPLTPLPETEDEKGSDDDDESNVGHWTDDIVHDWDWYRWYQHHYFIPERVSKHCQDQVRVHSRRETS